MNTIRIGQAKPFTESWKPELSDPLAPVAGFAVEVRYGHDPNLFGQAEIDDSIGKRSLKCRRAGGSNYLNIKGRVRGPSSAAPFHGRTARPAPGRSRRSSRGPRETRDWLPRGRHGSQAHAFAGISQSFGKRNPLHTTALNVRDPAPRLLFPSPVNVRREATVRREQNAFDRLRTHVRRQLAGLIAKLIECHGHGPNDVGDGTNGNLAGDEASERDALLLAACGGEIKKCPIRNRQYFQPLSPAILRAWANSQLQPPRPPHRLRTQVAVLSSRDSGRESPPARLPLARVLREYGGRGYRVARRISRPRARERSSGPRGQRRRAVVVVFAMVAANHSRKPPPSYARLPKRHGVTTMAASIA